MPLTQKPRTDPVLGNKEHWEYVGKLEETLTQVEEVIKDFFKTPANESIITDYSEAYSTLGKIKDIMEITQKSKELRRETK